MKRRLRAPFSLVGRIALCAGAVRADNRAGRDAPKEVSLLHRFLVRSVGAPASCIAALLLLASPASGQSTVPPVLPDSVAAELRAAMIAASAWVPSMAS